VTGNTSPAPDEPYPLIIDSVTKQRRELMTALTATIFLAAGLAASFIALTAWCAMLRAGTRQSPRRTLLQGF
jgi:hypothetical protein